MRQVCLLGLLVVLDASAANAEGEYGPMFGGSLVATRGVTDTGMAGGEIEMAVWHGRIGFALGLSRQAAVTGGGLRETAIDASLRVLLLSHLTPSLLESRDVEVGLEAQGIVEHAWWSNDATERSPVSYGLGLALRLRGGTDDVRSTLLAESRLFVRAMTSRSDGVNIAARGGMSFGAGDRELTVVVGLGAMFGGGQPRYADRFRMRPIDTQLLPILAH